MIVIGKKNIKMKGYIAFILLVIVLAEITVAQRSKSQVQVLENYKENPNSVSTNDLEKAYNAVCCNKKSGTRPGRLSREKRADGPICRWIRRVRDEIR